MRQDAQGLDISTDSDAVRDAYDDFVTGFLGYRADVAQRLNTLLTAGPDFALAHTVKGYATMMAFNAALVPAAAAAAAQARALSAGATPRERLHAAALTHWVEADLDAALAAWERVLSVYPTDIMAIKLVHFLTFWLGRKAEMAGSIERVLPAWNQTIPGYSALLACRCFAQEEIGNYALAEPEGRRAVEMDPADLWAAHAVAHVMEMQGRHDDGIAWLQSLAPNWSDGNNLRHHLAWHRALFHLERREFETVLALYDTGFRDLTSPLVEAMPDLYIDVQNAAAMLFRLQRQGVDVGNRWDELADKAESRIGDGLSAFTLPHWMLALAATGRGDAAARMLAGLHSFASQPGTVPAIVRDTAIPVCEAIRAHAAGAYDVAVATMRPVLPRLHTLGGSHAQLDVLEQFFLDAALRAGADNDVRVALARAAVSRPVSPRASIGWAAAAEIYSE